MGFESAPVARSWACCSATRRRPLPDFGLPIGRQLVEALPQAEIFYQGVMVKPGATAAFFAAVADEAVGGGRLPIGRVHSGVDPLQPLQEGCAQAGSIS